MAVRSFMLYKLKIYIWEFRETKMGKGYVHFSLCVLWNPQTEMGFWKSFSSWFYRDLSTLKLGYQALTTHGVSEFLGTFFVKK